MEKPVLGEEAWIDAALRVLAAEGVGGVRVEPLARRLGVTKGSFYWHFADREALLLAVVERWQRRATADVIALLEAEEPDPEARLGRLVRLTAGSRSAPDIEWAIRAWGVSDARVRERLAEVDKRRVRYVRSLLERCGLPRAVAARRAHLIYLVLVGEYARVSHGGERSGPAAWKELLAMALGR